MKSKRILKNCIDLINFYESLEGKYIPFHGETDEVFAHFSREGNKLFIDTNEKSPNSNKRNHNINNKKYKTDSQSGIKITSSLYRGETHHMLNKFEVYGFCDIESCESNLGFFRLVMQHKKKGYRIDHYFDNLLSISTDISSRGLNGSEVNIAVNHFTFYYSGEYFVIESSDTISRDCFVVNCHAILTGIGFISGYSPGDYGYIFKFDTIDSVNFSFYEFLSSFVSSYDDHNYTVIDSNIYSYIPEEDISNKEKRDEFIEEHKNDFYGISYDSFSLLCENLLNNEKFRDGIHSIMEARKSSLIAMGILYSVALESLSALVTDENKEKIFYIKDKTKRKALQEKLKNTAQKFFEDERLELELKDSPIEKRLNSINEPTNADKLIKPYELLNIPLFDDDKEIINHRNDFLHGKPICNLTIDDDNGFKKLWYIALRLNFLANAIALKYINHKGNIKNLSGLLLPDYSDKNQQPTFRRI